MNSTEETAKREEKTAPNIQPNIQRILDIELPLTVCFGASARPLREILKLAPGAVLELDRTADDPVLLKINNKVIARGEVVVVDGYYGIRIKEIDSAAERIASLGEMK
jgi:flagellar motor switch protein FliN